MHDYLIRGGFCQGAIVLFPLHSSLWKKYLFCFRNWYVFLTQIFQYFGFFPPELPVSPVFCLESSMWKQIFDLFKKLVWFFYTYISVFCFLSTRTSSFSCFSLGKNILNFLPLFIQLCLFILGSSSPCFSTISHLNTILKSCPIK